MEISNRLREFLEDPEIQKAINNYNINEIYAETKERGIFPINAELTQLFYSINIDPLKYMDTIPPDYSPENLDLKELNIPDNIVEIGYGAFTRCENLNKLTLNKNLKIIDDYAFADCIKLRELVIPISVTKIGMGAFSGCHKLTVIEYEGNIKQWLNIEMERDFSNYEVPGDDTLFEVSIISCADGDFRYKKDEGSSYGRWEKI